MDLLLACKRAVEYGGYKYISSIVRVEDGLIFGLCDEEGNDLFVAPVFVNILSGEVSDYSNLESDDNGYIEEHIPYEFCSNKRRVMLAVKDYGRYRSNCSDLMDCIYEKYNLYDISKPEVFGVLNYYMSILEDSTGEIDTSSVHEYIHNDYRNIIDLIDVSRSFQFIPNEFTKLERVYETLIEQAYCKYKKIDMSDVDIDEVNIKQLILKAVSCVKNTIYCSKQLNDDLNEIIRGIEYELGYIRGDIKDISEALKLLDSDLYSTSFDVEAPFGKK